MSLQRALVNQWPSTAPAAREEGTWKFFIRIAPVESTRQSPVDWWFPKKGGAHAAAGRQWSLVGVRALRRTNNGHAVARRGPGNAHPLESAAFSRRTPATDIDLLALLLREDTGITISPITNPSVIWSWRMTRSLIREGVHHDRV
jgi:hypothetical protein